MNGARIVRNTLATYLRSVVGAVAGLFSARWVLEALGKSDLGLCGVVTGVVFVFAFLTPVLNLSIGRFYAYSVADAAALRRWFNTSLALMAALAAALAAVAYPAGRYALGHWLAVPAGRMDAALAALGFSVGSAAVSMLAVPYTAMFTAKQDIVEASAFQLAQTLIVFVFAAFMKIAISVSGRGGVDWLVAYAAALALTSAALAAAQVWRVRSKYRECRIDAGLMFGGGRVKPLLAFAGWQFLGGFAWTVRSQGLAFFVNVLFGTAYNASYTISTQVSNHAASLSSSLNNALSPVLSAAEGGGRRPEVMRLARFGNRLGGALALAFAVPLALFMDDVLKLWLVEPPPGCALLCTAMLAVAVLRQFTAGCGLAILARGGLGPWQICDALAIAAALPAAWLLWRCGLGIASIGWAFVLSETAEAAVRVYFSGKMRNE